MCKKFSIFLLLILFYAAADAAMPGDVKAREQAQDEALAETENQADILQKIDVYARSIPNRSVEAMAGEVEIFSSEAEYSYTLKVCGKLPVKFSLAEEYIEIEDSLDSVELPSHLIGVTTDIETTLPFFKFDKTYLRIGVSPSFYADDWDFPASSFRIPVRSLLIYQPNDKLTLIAGVAVYPDSENEVWPILGLIYKPNDKLTFELLPKRPNINYQLNNKVAIFAEGGVANSEFEVQRDNDKNVVLRYKEMRLGSGMKFKFNKFIQSSLSAGAIFNRYLKYRDDQGKVNIKDGLYTEFRIEIGI
jgi:hypothetical protein